MQIYVHVITVHCRTEMMGYLDGPLLCPGNDFSQLDMKVHMLAGATLSEAAYHAFKDPALKDLPTIKKVLKDGFPVSLLTHQIPSDAKAHFKWIGNQFNNVAVATTHMEWIEPVAVNLVHYHCSID